MITLTKCAACGADVSPRAHACPRCGDPMTPGGVQLVEATSKRWKLIQLGGGIVAFLGFAGAVAALFRPDRPIPASQDMVLNTACVIAFAGLIGAAIGRVGAWWHHG